MVRLRNGITMLMGMIVGAWLMWQLSARVREDAADYRRMNQIADDVFEEAMQVRMQESGATRAEILADLEIAYHEAVEDIHIRQGVNNVE